MPDDSVWNIDPGQMAAAVLPGLGAYLGFVAIILLGFALIWMVGR